MHDISDVYDLDPATLSLCEGCAKDEHLKRFVTENIGGGALCGVCLSPHWVDYTCKLDRKGDLANLIKALVRFHFDESAYNPHWGGEDDPSELFYSENPILEHETTIFHTRGREVGAAFLEDLFASEPYPDPALGISVYAGSHPDFGRMMHQAISRGNNGSFWELRQRLFTENYFNVEPKVMEFLEKADRRIERIVPAGTEFARARIGAKRFAKLGEGAQTFEPFQGSELSSPPAPKANSGRLNRTGVAFLYLASDEKTAASEVRPHPGHVLSLGKFVTSQDLKIAAFDVGILEFFGSESDLYLFDFLFTADKAMSMPALPEDSMRYSITQLIADAVRNAGYDGITYRSSVAKGQNICVFNPELLSYCKGSASAVAVTEVVYSTSPVDLVDPASMEDYYPLDR